MIDKTAHIYVYKSHIYLNPATYETFRAAEEAFEKGLKNIPKKKDEKAESNASSNSNYPADSRSSYTESSDSNGGKAVK